MAITLDGTKGLVLPSWSNASRPANPENGQMGYNTDLGNIEWYYSPGTEWVRISDPSGNRSGATAEMLSPFLLMGG